jgi:hypothetical protein
MVFKDKLLVQRADASFKVRVAQKADAPKAMRDYREKQQASLDQMQKLKDQRLARERSKER